MVINYDTFPTRHMRDSVERWIEHGIRPGSFLTNLLSNNLLGTCSHADSLNQHKIFEIVCWFYNEAPSGCWGSVENVAEWKGLKNV